MTEENMDEVRRTIAGTPFNLEGFIAADPIQKALMRKFGGSSIDPERDVIKGDDYTLIGATCYPDVELDARSYGLLQEMCSDMDVLVFGLEKAMVDVSEGSSVPTIAKIATGRAPIRYFSHPGKNMRITDDTVGIDLSTWSLLGVLCSDISLSQAELDTYSQVWERDITEDRDKVLDYWRARGPDPSLDHLSSGETLLFESDLKEISIINHMFYSLVFHHSEGLKFFQNIREKFPEKKLGVIVPRENLRNVHGCLEGTIEKPDWGTFLKTPEVINLFGEVVVGMGPNNENQYLIDKIRSTYQHIETALERGFRVENAGEVVTPDFRNRNNE